MHLKNKQFSQVPITTDTFLFCRCTLSDKVDIRFMFAVTVCIGHQHWRTAAADTLATGVYDIFACSAQHRDNVGESIEMEYEHSIEY